MNKLWYNQYNGILLSNIKQQTTDTYNMNKSQICLAKWKKPDQKGYWDSEQISRWRQGLASKGNICSDELFCILIVVGYTTT